MPIKHHPDIANLMSCAAGSQPEALAAVMAAHIAMCPECAAEVSKLEAIGVALFEGLSPAPVQRSAPVVRARAGEANHGSTMPEPGPGGDVPAPLVGRIGHRLDDIAWKRLGPGIWHYPLSLSKGAEGDLRLLKVAPGKAVPEHGHGGAELTLLLKGSYHDAIGEFQTGDVADLDADVEHQPIAGETEGCICLVASERKARFKSLFARLVQPLTGM